MPDIKQNMSGNPYLTFAILLAFGAGLWSFYTGFRILREYKVLEDTPRIPIRSVAMGFVHIRGKPESERILTSPVSKTPCCFYKVVIEEWKNSGSHSWWDQCCTDMDGYRFFLADETGRILIDANVAEYELPLYATCEVSSGRSGPVRIWGAGWASDSDLLRYVNYAKMHRMYENVPWADGRYRLTEYLIVPGQEYMVSGTCMENDASDAGSDRNLIGKGHSEPTFVISAKSDVALQTSLRKRARLMVLGGPALALACLGWLLVRFHLF